MAVTVKDIARETGLGVATVSAYLNGNSVRAENKIKLDAAVERLGYVRNEFARALKTRKSGNVALVTRNLSDNGCADTVERIQTALQSRGFGALLIVTENGLTKSTMDFVQSKMCDGIVYISNTEKNPAALSATGQEYIVIAIGSDTEAAVTELLGKIAPVTEPEHQKRNRQENTESRSTGIRCEVSGVLD